MNIDISPLYHAIAAVALQCAVGLVSGDWFTGGASTSFYVKESGTGNTGWIAK